MNEEKQKKYLTYAQAYANESTGCKKVAVGSLIVDEQGTVVSLGANRAMPNLCKATSCLRVEKYGDNSKTHRNPEDCRAIHSEIDAISTAAKHGMRLKGTSIFVTRYPCEACARAIVSAGIYTVYYGREQTISELTSEILREGGVEIIHVSSFKEADVVE